MPAGVADVGQGVVLGADADHEIARAVLGDEGGLQATDGAGDIETSPIERIAAHLGRVELLEGEFGVVPQLVRHRHESVGHSLHSQLSGLFLPGHHHVSSLPHRGISTSVAHQNASGSASSTSWFRFGTYARPMVDRTGALSSDQPVRRTLTLEHDGESLDVEVLGEGGVPLVLSHGPGGNHAVWIHPAAHFARDRTVVLWDHRGFGRSTDHADRTSPSVAAADLLAILDHLGIERADLVGQSMGGWTSLGAALVLPQVVRSLVLADSLAGLTSSWC